MILADTSVWIDHFRSKEQGLLTAAADGQLLVHEFVIVELALGAVPGRDKLLMMLGTLPRSETLSSREVLEFIDRHSLMSTGVGFVDAHMLASVAHADDARLWTHDKRLLAQAEKLELAYSA